MTTKAQTIQYQLDAWKKEYGITQVVKFDGYKELSTKTKIVLGRCWMYSTPYLRATVEMGIKFENRSLGWLELSVLWHEYCHAEAFLEDGVNDSHNSTFKAKRRRKAKYWIGDMVAKFVYIFL